MNKGKIKLVSICMAAALAAQPVMGAAAAKSSQSKEAAEAKEKSAGGQSEPGKRHH